MSHFERDIFFDKSIKLYTLVVKKNGEELFRLECIPWETVEEFTDERIVQFMYDYDHWLENSTIEKIK